MIGMLPFVLKFPEIGEAETRVITAFNDIRLLTKIGLDKMKWNF
jgi:hypothetical protein